MTSSKPYLVRAFYEWIVDNDCTPYMVVDATMEEVDVPERYIEDGQIVLNVSYLAVQNLELEQEYIYFEARFGGISHQVYAPIEAVLAIYAKENGRGMVFNDEHESDEEDDLPPDDTTTAEGKTSSSGRGKKGESKKPFLTVVK